MKQIKIIVKHMRLKLAFYSMLAFLFALLILEIPLDKTVIIGFFSFLFLNIGANLFNDYYDKDHGPLIGLETPTKITKKIIYSAWIMKIFGLLLSVFLLNIFFTSLYILGIICSFVYSHKSTRAKSNPFLSVLFGIGSGSAIFLAGALLGKGGINIQLILGMIVAGLFLSSFHIITQIYETREDKKRHDNTIALIYGKRVALLLSLLFFIFSGIGGVYLFYLMRLNLYVIDSVAMYFLFVIYLMTKWIQKEPESDLKDYHIVKYFIPYLTMSAYFVVLAMYWFYIP